MRKDVMYTAKRLINSMTIRNEENEVGLKINISKIARENNCDWRTAKKYIEGFTPKERKPRPSKLDYFKPFIIEKYSQGATAISIYKYLIQRGYNGKIYEGKYTILRTYCKSLKDNKAKKAVVRYESLPGEQGQMDWKEKFKLTSRNGEIYELNIFLYTLSYSRHKYLEVTLDKEQNTLFKCLINAFKYTGGVPKTILFDNMKTVVDRSRSEFRKVVLNENFRQFSLDMCFDPKVCRAYRPQSKGRVENMAKLVDRLKVYNNEFESIEDIYQIVADFNKEINNEINQATKKKPIELLKKEKEYLQQLNDILAQRYITEPIIKRKVNRESMIEYKSCKYSVPPHLIGKMVEIKVEANQLFIYYNNLLVVSHQIKGQKYNYLKDHLIEILDNDAFKHYDNEEIERLAEVNLEKFDIIYKIGEIK